MACKNDLFDRAICKIYESVIDTEVWDAAMDAIVDATNCKYAAVFQYEPCVYQICTGSRELRKSNNDVEALNELLRIARNNSLDVDYFEFKTPNAGLFNVISVPLDSGKKYLVLVLNTEYSSQSLMQKCLCLAKHVSQAMQIGYEKFNSYIDSVNRVFDKITASICLMTGDGRVASVNYSAQDLISQCPHIRISANQELTFSNQQDNREVKNAFLRISSEFSTHEEVVCKFNEQDVLLIDMTSIFIRSFSQNLDASFTLVTFSYSKFSHSLDASRLGRAYGLTLSEIEVCRLILSGLTNEQVARVRNVSKETVKAQAKSIGEKTGSRSRLALLQIANTLSPTFFPIQK